MEVVTISVEISLVKGQSVTVLFNLIEYPPPPPPWVHIFSTLFSGKLAEL